ncbi:MAG TPA: DUF4349 domain-containing protein [Gaiellaceae bacterium]|jgi:hypothetical protein
MSQRDVLAELRTAHVAAPPQLRQRVRLIAVADDTSPRRLITWRRSVALLVPVAAAVAAAVVLTRPAVHHPQPLSVQHGEAAHANTAPAPKAFALPSTKARAQKYSATLSLRVPGQPQLSDAVKHALRITSSLGGYLSSTHVSTSSAQLVLKVPRTKVQVAITRLSALGTITSEQVAIQDQQSGINANSRTIQRLQRELKTATTKQQIATLTARIEQLQRANANTVRADRYATLRLNFTTPTPAAKHHSHGPLHGIGVAFKWIGIGSLYALAFGVPLVLLVLAARLLRKRRIDSMLSRF